MRNFHSLFSHWTFWKYYPTYRNATVCYTTWDAARQLPRHELFKRNIVLRDRGSLHNLKIETLKSYHCVIFRFRRFNLKVEQIWRNCIVHTCGFSRLFFTVVAYVATHSIIKLMVLFCDINHWYFVYNTY